MFGIRKLVVLDNGKSISLLLHVNMGSQGRMGVWLNIFTHQSTKRCEITGKGVNRPERALGVIFEPILSEKRQCTCFNR